ncbi:MAG: S-layer homology domain-containing protein [Synechococcales bacterium]|nr:S-layer homology domain-containing protein [Synechococcales bacterium]
MAIAFLAKSGQDQSRQGFFSHLGVTFLSSLLVTGCGSNWQEALKPDPRLEQPTTPTPIASSPLSPAPEPTITSSSYPSHQPSPNTQLSDLDQVSPQLRSYVEQMQRLAIVIPTPGRTAVPSLNQPVTRREYARWLVAVNNRFFDRQPAKQIRLADGGSQAAFQDIAKSDPDFGAIQGLAEAGLIPSKLTSETSSSQFRPDATLIREDLIAWKVPVDTRQALPKATLENLNQTWGFQDSEKIDPKALRAIYMDHQNGDQANIRRAFGYTTLFQPKRTVTRAEAIAVLWHLGFQSDGISAPDLLKGEAKMEEPNQPSENNP